MLRTYRKYCSVSNSNQIEGKKGRFVAFYFQVLVFLQNKVAFGKLSIQYIADHLPTTELDQNHRSLDW